MVERMISRALKLPLVTATLFVCSLGGAVAADLTVKIKDVQNANGTILMALHDGADGFPKSRKPVAVISLDAKIGEVLAVFPDLDAGAYAISLYHDENGNKELDTNFLGVPTEGYAFTNNAKGAFGPPSFENAAIKIEEENLIAEMKVSY